MKTCDYFGCTKPLAPDQPETGMKFCVEHDAQFEAIAKREPFNPAALVKFWIDAQGGPIEAAKRMFREE